MPVLPEITAEAWVAIATFALALATFALAFLTYRMVRRTSDVAEATRRLVIATDAAAATAKEELAHAKSEAASAADPFPVCGLRTELASVVQQRPGVEFVYLIAQLRLVNYGGHGIIQPLRVTGSPRVETRPLDVVGFIPSGGSRDFDVVFDAGRGDTDLEATASIDLLSRPVRGTKWTRRLFIVKVRHTFGAVGDATAWRAEVTEPVSGQPPT